MNTYPEGFSGLLSEHKGINPNVATTVAELQQKADAAVVQERIASRAEITMFRWATPGSATSFFL